MERRARSPRLFAALVAWLTAFALTFAAAVASAAPALEIPAVPADFTTKVQDGITFKVVPGAEPRLAPALERLDDDVAALTETFGGRPILRDLEVRIVREPEDLARFAPAAAPPPAYASGVAYPGLRLVIVALRAPRSFEAVNVPEVLRHELVHVALHDAVGGKHVPRWFDEGVAVHLSGERLPARTEALYKAAQRGALLPLADLDRNFPEDGAQVDVAYAESADFIRFLLRPQDRARFASLLGRVSGSTPFPTALTDAYGTSLRTLEFEWKKDVDSRKGSALVEALATGTLLWGIGVIALGFAWWKMRRRARVIRARWDEEEQQEARLAEELRALLAAGPVAEGEDAEQIVAPRPLPHIEHDGRRYTLH